MKITKLLLVCVCGFSSLFALDEKPSIEEVQPADIRNAFTHVDLGLGPFPLPLPVFGVGKRVQWGHHGFDLSFSVSTIVAITQVKASALYLHYFKPNLKSQSYIGAGIGPSGLFGSGEGFAALSPEFVFGKEYRNEDGDRRFFQAQISFPTYVVNHEMIWFPLVVFSYGIGF